MTKHFLYVPFTGLGKFNGFRGNRWLRNRITVFKEYVVRSLKAQTNKDFTLWVSWRPEEKKNPYVQELTEWMKTTGLTFVFTYHGVCFWDDKYPNDVAYERLINALHGSIGELYDYIGDVDQVLMTIQPSDDCYRNISVDHIQRFFEDWDKRPFSRINPGYHAQKKPDWFFFAGGFQKGYICNYSTKEVSDYNPKTNPPFYTIRFPREVFTDPLQHVKWTAMRYDEGGYKAGTPLPSHEYLKNVFEGGYAKWDVRGFLVGTHGENISTYYDHPYKGIGYGEDDGFEILSKFGIDCAPLLRFKLGWKRWILKKLPHRIRRKIRYWFTEVIYDWLRS